MKRFSWLPFALLLSGNGCRPTPALEAPAAALPATVRVETVTVSMPTGSQGWSLAERDSALAELARQRAAWTAVRPARYRYREHRWCFCFMTWSGPRVVTVVSGRVVNATDTTGRRSDPAYVRSASRRPLGGIDALFDEIATGIRDTAYAQVRVTFAPGRGYPTSVTFDQLRYVNDDELYIDVTRVEAWR